MTDFTELVPAINAYARIKACGTAITRAQYEAARREAVPVEYVIRPPDAIKPWLESGVVK